MFYAGPVNGVLVYYWREMEDLEVQKVLNKGPKRQHGNNQIIPTADG